MNKIKALEDEIKRLEVVRLTPKSNINSYLESINSPILKDGISAKELMKRPEISYFDIVKMLDLENPLPYELGEELNIEVNNPTYLFSLPNEYNFSGITVHTLDLFFKVTIDDNAQISTADDVASAQFYNLNNVNIEDIGLNSIKQAIKKLKKEL